jgi:hypothetical protein
MNKTISLAAIAMVAVIMGMSAFAPDAMAVRNADHNPKVVICHFDFNDPAGWEADKLVNKHALIAHQAHGDEIILNADQPTGTITVAECLAQDPLDPPVV